MSVNSKQKGSRAERECAKIFEKYLDGYFQRVPSSGAFTGGMNAARKNNMSETQIRAAKSDIIPPDEYPKLVIEVKHYKDFPYHGFVTSAPMKLLDQWLSELEYDCDKDDIGVLCFKTNNKKWALAISSSHLNKFNLSSYAIYQSYIITDMEQFLSSNSDNFKKLVK